MGGMYGNSMYGNPMMGGMGPMGPMGFMQMSVNNVGRFSQLLQVASQVFGDLDIDLKSNSDLKATQSDSISETNVFSESFSESLHFYR